MRSDWIEPRTARIERHVGGVGQHDVERLAAQKVESRGPGVGPHQLAVGREQAQVFGAIATGVAEDQDARSLRHGHLTPAGW